MAYSSSYGTFKGGRVQFIETIIVIASTKAMASIVYYTIYGAKFKIKDEVV